MRIDLFACRLIQGKRASLPIRLVVDRQAQDVLGSPFDDQQPGLTVVKEHGNPAALEVEGHFIDLVPAAHVDFFVLQDGVIQRTLHSGFKKAVKVSQTQNALAFPSQGVHVALQMDAGLGQGARFVGA